MSVCYGPDVDNSFYHSSSAALPAVGAGDFCWLMTFRIDQETLGSPALSTGSSCFTASTFFTGSGTGGNDSYVAFFPVNSGFTSARGRLRVRLSRSGVRAGAASFYDTSSTFGRGDVVTTVLQSRGGTVQFWTCQPGNPAVLHASESRNGSFGAQDFGTWHLGHYNWKGTTERFHLASASLTQAEIEAIASGAHPSTVVSAGSRLAGWTLDSLATISAEWGGLNLDAVGAPASAAVCSALVVSSGSAVTVAEPEVNGSVGVGFDGSAVTHTFSGTYTGPVPAGMEIQIVEAAGGAVVVPWTASTGFGASAGAWSGAVTVPVGGRYRVMCREIGNPTREYLGGLAWLACPVFASMGQSPMTLFETDGIGTQTFDAGARLYVGRVATTETNASDIVPADASGTGAGLVALANRWHAVTGLPLLWIVGASPGSSSAQWAAQSAAVKWPEFAGMVTRLAPSNVNYVWLNGSADQADVASIPTNHDQILSNLASLPPEHRYVMLPHNRQTSGVPATNGAVRAAQLSWAENHAEAGSTVVVGPWPGAMQMDADASGGQSPHQTVESSVAFAPLLAQHLAWLHGLTAVQGVGPKIVSATRPNGGDGRTVTVNVQHRSGSNLRTVNGGTDAVGLAGFQVSDSEFASDLTISSAVVAGPTSVNLTLATPPQNLAALAVRFGRLQPVSELDYAAVEAGGLGDLPRDDSGVAGVAGGLLEPTYEDVVVVELPAFIAPWGRLSAAGWR